MYAESDHKIVTAQIRLEYLLGHKTEMHPDIINEVWDNMACLIIQAANAAIPKKKVLNSLANRRKKIGKTTNLAKYFTILRKIIQNLNKI
ncbi:37224_t:CDS:2 [Gigaspora margarita]|uniref:37224_t:CDS:1 n=1 Tax=Gigaspora margarita TaxID=4874 RepID=A0ABM8W2X9_GIGMA|nr:37224_t:CDS:2 [Gigaspora margarita]